MTLIDQIFGNLTIRYGRDFLSRWEGQDLGLVKADWAEELQGLSTASIVYGLDHIDPAKPPTVSQFRETCLRYSKPPQLALDRPAADPERVAAEIKKMRNMQENSPKAWAYRLQARERNGERLTCAQRDMWRWGLGRESGSDWNQE